MPPDLLAQGKDLSIVNKLFVPVTLLFETVTYFLTGLLCVFNPRPTEGATKEAPPVFS